MLFGTFQPNGMWQRLLKHFKSKSRLRMFAMCLAGTPLTFVQVTMVLVSELACLQPASLEAKADGD